MARLDQLLASNLDLSRREVARLLAQGAVQDTEGNPLLQGRRSFDPSKERVLIRGKATTLYEHYSLIQHKPLGCVTALKDARHPTAYELLRQAPLFRRLRPVGRLDLDTSGLLIWTSRGPMVHALTHPRRAVPRRYQVGLHRPHAPLPCDLRLKDGHRPKIQALNALEPDELHPGLQQNAQIQSFAEITLLGGAYHEVRRIFAALGSHVLSLCRVQHGVWKLPETLQPGQFQAIDLEE